jgi:hypothetical protein
MAKPKGRTMKINSTTPSLTPARSFLEMLEFRVNRSDRGASVLSIGAGGDDREFAPVHLWPDEITSEQHLRHYGIMHRLYRDFYGEPKMPRPQKAPGFLNRDFMNTSQKRWDVRPPRRKATRSVIISSTRRTGPPS